MALLYVWQSVAAYLVERRQKQQIKSAFNHYLAPELVEELAAHPEKLRLGGERRELTLLFADLEGFTAVAEQLAPEEVAKLLNNYLSVCVREVLRYGGTIDKFMGDALMAFWGAPLEDVDHARHACEAAVAMRERVRELQHDDYPELNLRIGVHTGSVLVGNLGAEQVFNYTAVGDDVNLASRLEGANKVFGTSILLSESTVASLGENGIACRYVDQVRVKGKQRSVVVYTLAPSDWPQGVETEIVKALHLEDWEKVRQLWEELSRLFPEDALVKRQMARFMDISKNQTDWTPVIDLEKS